MKAVREQLVDRAHDASLDVLDSQITQVRAFTEALANTLDDPTQKIERLQVQRWTRLVLLAAVLGGVAIALPYSSRGPDLAGVALQLARLGGCKSRQIAAHVPHEADPTHGSRRLGGQKTYVGGNPNPHRCAPSAP